MNPFVSIVNFPLVVLGPTNRSNCAISCDSQWIPSSYPMQHLGCELPVHTSSGVVGKAMAGSGFEAGQKMNRIKN